MISVVTIATILPIIYVHMYIEDTYFLYRVPTATKPTTVLYTKEPLYSPPKHQPPPLSRHAYYQKVQLLTQSSW